MSCVEKITNYLEIHPRLGTAGQPTVEQFAALCEAGYQVVINLVPHSSPHFVLDEEERVTRLGMDYVHIPVVWTHPTRKNLDQFFAAMAQYAGQKVFVHCVMNMRVSVFVFLYRVLVLGEPVQAARLAMEKIWAADSTWTKFIQEQLG